MVTSTPDDEGTQIESMAVAARNSTIPAHCADQSQPGRYAELADRFATDGPVALGGALRRLIRDARRHGVTPLLVTVLADPAQPDVARQRAFGRIVAELERPHQARPHTRRGPARHTPRPMRPERVHALPRKRREP